MTDRTEGRARQTVRVDNTSDLEKLVIRVQESASFPSGMGNGLIVLETGNLIKSQPTLPLSLQTEVSYDRNAPEPTEWLKFLKATWPDDEIRDYIWRAVEVWQAVLAA